MQLKYCKRSNIKNVLNLSLFEPSNIHHATSHQPSASGTTNSHKSIRKLHNPFILSPNLSSFTFHIICQKAALSEIYATAKPPADATVCFCTLLKSCVYTVNIEEHLTHFKNREIFCMSVVLTFPVVALYGKQ